MSARLLVIALLLLPRSAIGQVRVDPSPFATVPCPAVSWTYEEPRLTPLAGARLFTGRYSGGVYAIEIPDRWNGELVLWAHGNVNPDSVTGKTVRVQVPLLREHWIRNGFAWAASSYRCNGSVTGVGLFDTMALRSLAEKFAGGRALSRVYLTGVSLGGRIVTLGLREFPSEFAGGLAQCPMGQETNDVRVAIAAAAEYLTGVRPTAATIHHDLLRMRDVLGSPGGLTDKGRQLASIQIELTGGPRPFALEGLASRFFDNIRFGVTNNPDAIVRAGTNVYTAYGIANGLGLSSAVLNTRVPRKPAEGLLRSRSGPYRETLPFDGFLSRPLLTIHGTGDLQVPVSQEQALKRAVVRAGRESLLVQRLIRVPGHCQFSQGEQARAFDDLVTWVRSGVAPEGDAVLGDLSNAGLRFTEPRRAGDPGQVNIAAPKAPQQGRSGAATSVTSYFRNLLPHFVRR